ncbi:hypothetical protein ACWFRK_42305, partial [Streptomyces sp. NPDC055157]
PCVRSGAFLFPRAPFREFAMLPDAMERPKSFRIARGAVRRRLEADTRTAARNGALDSAPPIPAVEPLQHSFQ